MMILLLLFVCGVVVVKVGKRSIVDKIMCKKIIRNGSFALFTAPYSYFFILRTATCTTEQPVPYVPRVKDFFWSFCGSHFLYFLQ